MSALGHPRLHLRVCDSTNVRARELAAAGAPHGTLVTAAEQTAGRGRQGRQWSAPPGRALLCSLVLRRPPALLPLAAGVAVAETADGAGAPPPAAIKWPNDVLAGGRKLAGILVEGRPQEGWAVLGIGFNVAVDVNELPADVRVRAASLGLEPGAVDDVLAALLERLETWIAASEAEILAACRARDALAGQPVIWAGGEGTGEGIDDAGSLLVRTPGGELLALDAGEVHLGQSSPSSKP